MNSQRGAALVAVMSILTVALMLGVTGMQSSFVNERLAGNYSATANVQMAAEMAAAQGWEVVRTDPDKEDHAPDSVNVNEVRGMGWRSFTDDDLMDDEESFFSKSAIRADCGEEIECRYRVFESCEGANSCIVAMAAIMDDANRVLAESEQVTLEYRLSSGDDSSSSPGPGSGPGERAVFTAAAEACEDVTLTGSGRVNGNVLAGADVEMSGGVLPPSSVVVGGEVRYPDWWKYDDDKVEAVADYQEGQDVYPDGCDTLGVRDDGGELGSLFTDISGSAEKQSLAGWFDAVSCSHCYSVGGRGVTLTGGSGSSDASITFLGSSGDQLVLEVSGDLNTQGRLSELVVRGDVTLIVDGDFDLGGNARLTVAEGASLTVYTTGQVTLSGGTNLLVSESFMRETSAGEVRPAVAILSAYQQISGNPGVTVGGNNQSQVAIYAPYSDVRVTGSGSVTGSVRGRNVELTGAGSVTFAAGLEEFQVGEEGPDASGPPAGILSWG